MNSAWFLQVKAPILDFMEKGSCRHCQKPVITKKWAGLCIHSDPANAFDPTSVSSAVVPFYRTVLYCRELENVCLEVNDQLLISLCDSPACVKTWQNINHIAFMGLDLEQRMRLSIFMRWMLRYTEPVQLTVYLKNVKQKARKTACWNLKTPA